MIPPDKGYAWIKGSLSLGLWLGCVKEKWCGGEGGVDKESILFLSLLSSVILTLPPSFLPLNTQGQAPAGTQ